MTLLHWILLFGCVFAAFGAGYEMGKMAERDRRYAETSERIKNEHPPDPSHR